MAGEHPLDRLDATGLAAAVRDGEIGAREVVEESIARIERHDPALNAIAHTPSTRPAPRSRPVAGRPLRGVPVLVKDLYADVAGLPSTRGAGSSPTWCRARTASWSALPSRGRGRARHHQRARVRPATPAPRASLRPVPQPPRPGAVDRRLQRGQRGRRRDPDGAGGDGQRRRRVHPDPGVDERPVRAPGPGGAGSARAAPLPAVGAGERAPRTHHDRARQRAAARRRARAAARRRAFAAPTPSARRSSSWPPGCRVGCGSAWPPGRATARRPPRRCSAVLRQAADLLADLGHEVVETTLDYVLEESQGGGAVLMGAGFAAAVDARLTALGRELRDDDLEPFSRVLYEHYRSPLTGIEVHPARRRRSGWAGGSGGSSDPRSGGFDVLPTPTLADPVPPLGTWTPPDRRRSGSTRAATRRSRRLQPDRPAGDSRRRSAATREACRSRSRSPPTSAARGRCWPSATQVEQVAAPWESPHPATERGTRSQSAVICGSLAPSPAPTVEARPIREHRASHHRASRGAP